MVCGEVGGTPESLIVSTMVKGDDFGWAVGEQRCQPMKNGNEVLETVFGVRLWLPQMNLMVLMKPAVQALTLKNGKHMKRPRKRLISCSGDNLNSASQKIALEYVDSYYDLQ
jgi:hypothetical protein